MPNPSFVCAHDPRRPEAVGTVVSEPRTLHKGAALGAIFLPLDASLLRRLPGGGFVRRSWGVEGWAFDANRAEGGAPLALQIANGSSLLHWAAEVAPSPASAARPVVAGKLQLALIRTTPGVLAPGFSQLEQPLPFEVPRGGQLVLRGAIRLNSLIDGFLALQLWGVCHGISVRWLAATQCEVSE